MAGDPLRRLTAGQRAAVAPARGASWRPMLATLTHDAFSDAAWVFERKLDGVRCLAHRTRAGAVLRSRNDLDMSATYPEIVDALSAGLDTDAVLDGEIVAFDGRRTSFARLQGRLGVHDAAAARASGVAVHYYVFDVLALAGHDVRGLPLLTRKGLLRDAVRFGGPVHYARHRREAGEAEFRAACERGDEGVVAKRADAPYGSGRSKDWLKIKCVRDQELVVGGWTDPQGSRTGLGALLVGYYDGADLVYAGRVGTGFAGPVLAELGARLADLATASSPFTRGRVRERGVHWVRPELVAQIGFAEWTRDGLLRHPRFDGLRTDKSAREVVRET